MQMRSLIFAATTACGLLAACSESAPEDLSDVAHSGKYSDLSGSPDLAPFAKSADLHAVAVSGSYGDLEGTPDLTVYATSAGLSPVALSGEYEDLLGKPDLSVYAPAENLSSVAFTGSYADLDGTPDLSIYAHAMDLSPVASSGRYDDLAGLPWTGDASQIYSSANVTVAGEGQEPFSVQVPNFGALEIDQASAADSTIYGPFITHWQSFTPEVNGLLAGIDVDRGGPGEEFGYTLNIYEGEGIGGNHIYTQSGIRLPSGVHTVTLSTPLRLEASKQYTWEFVHPTPFMLIGYNWATYAGGRGGGDPTPDTDYHFATWMRPELDTSRPALTVTASSFVGVGTKTPTVALDVAGELRVRTTSSPASNDPCQPGQISWDGGYVYVCVAVDTWKRAQLSAY